MQLFFPRSSVSSSPGGPRHCCLQKEDIRERDVLEPRVRDEQSGLASGGLGTFPCLTP